MTSKTRLIYDIISCEWYEPITKTYFTQLVQQYLDDGWELVGAAFRHPDPAKQYWYQTMVKKEVRRTRS